MYHSSSMAKKSSVERKRAEASPSQKRRRVSRTAENNNVKFSKKGSSEDRSIITMRISDPEVLDCPICLDFQTIPIYQCENGHVACSKCCNELHNKCAICSFPIGFIRCRALEKVLESVKIPCPYADYGCKEEPLSYSEKNNHKLDCTYEPCSCPYSGCDVVASSKDLYQHFMDEHCFAGLSFMYDHHFSDTLDFDCEQAPINILQEVTDGNLFILHNDVVRGVGNAISVSCIGPKSNHGYQYEIRAESEGCCLRFKSFTKNIQELDDDNDGTRSSRVLFVPSGYFGASKSGEFEIVIWRND